MKLTSRIKDLETSILLLINILKRNNIKLPKGFNEPQIDLDINKLPLSTQNLFSATKSTEEIEQCPLHIHLVLPPLSQVKTSTVLTLTATAPIMSSYVSTMSIVDDDKPSPAISSDTPEKNENTAIDHSDVDFSKAKIYSNSQLNLRSSERPMITEVIPFSLSSTTAKAAASIAPVISENNNINTITSSSKSISLKSSTQGFGIDSILVQDMNPTSRNLLGTTTSLSTIQADQICDKTDTSLNRQRLSSSGHTVAALLDSSMPTKVNEQRTTTNNNGNNKGIQDNNEAIKSHTFQNSEPKTASANSLTSKARWGNLLESAHSSDKYHLSSFTLSSNKKQGNKRNQKSTKEAKNQSFNKTSKHQESQPTKYFSSLTSSASTCIIVKSTITTSGANITTQCQQINNLSSTRKTLENPPDCMEKGGNQVHANQRNTNKPILPHLQSSAISLNVNPPSSSSIPGHVCVANSKQMLISNSTTSTANDKQETKNFASTLSKPILHPEKINQINNSEKPATVTVRTMKDRSIRNKWLTSSDNTLLKSTSPTLQISTSECTIEECASPVISYPNVGKRKRKLIFNSGNQQINGHSIVNLSKGQNTEKNLIGTSQNFTAESLCRSSNVSNKGKRTTKGITPKKSKRDETLSLKTCGPDNLKTQITNNSSTSANTLPTILNIFAPAPVPTSQVSTQQQQQQSFQSTFSNFSAETLASNENIGVMDTGGNFSINNFSDNILMTGNSQMFSNFSANSLINGNEPMEMTSMMGQPNNWNNTNNANWMPQDMNDAFFQNMTSVRPTRQQQMLPVSTECSPIKSIMSILNSTPNNQANFQFDPQDQNAAMSNFFSNNQQQQQHQQQSQQQQEQPQLIQIRNMRNNLNFNPGNECNDYMMNPWYSTNKVNASVSRNPNALNLPTPASWPNFHTMHNQAYRLPGKESNISYNFPQSTINPNNFPGVNQNEKNVMKSRAGGDTTGPMFGNISLVNSISQS